MLLPFVASDVEKLSSVQPSDWDNIQPHFNFYLKSNFCRPYKIVMDEIVAVGTIIFHGQTAWLAHVIVHSDHRNKGLGTMMTSGLVQLCDRKKYPTVYLIATDLGYPVYRKIGFEVEGIYHHLKQTRPQPVYKRSPHTQTATTQDAEAIYEMDRVVSGEDRRIYLSSYIDKVIIYKQGGIIQGVYFPTLLNGYIMAIDADAGLELMRERIIDHDSAILPAENIVGLKFLEKEGFKLTATSRRMHLGPAKVWSPVLMFNRISGQIG